MDALRGKIFPKNYQKTPLSTSFSGETDSPHDFFKGDGDLSKEIFYACKKCEGPLVPISFCAVCKRTTLRKCIKCEEIKEMKSHESCKRLFSFSGSILQKHSGVSK